MNKKELKLLKKLNKDSKNLALALRLTLDVILNEEWEIVKKGEKE